MALSSMLSAQHKNIGVSALAYYKSALSVFMLPNALLIIK